MTEKKYYWLKLPKDFFKRHDIKFIKTLPHGYEIVLFYLELMAESIDHEGELRFSPKIPYTEEMLASATDTDIEIVRMAMQTLMELDLDHQRSTAGKSEAQARHGSSPEGKQRALEARDRLSRKELFQTVLRRLYGKHL